MSRFPNTTIVLLSLPSTMCDLEKLFNKAADCVQANATRGTGKKLDDKSLLELYAYYKVATIGPCNEPQPGRFNLKARSKWNAWKKMSDITQNEAMQSYIDKVKVLYDVKLELESLSDDDSGGDKIGSTHASLGTAVSTLLRVEDDENEDETIFKWAKDNNIPAIKSWLESKNNINCQDDEGLTPLHWIVDRGHLEACKLYLQYSPDLNICDTDGQTPLDYAVTCEHADIISLIQEKMDK